MEAKDLRVGDVFVGVNGELSTLTNAVRVKQDGGVAVFNFKVEGNHNYFILAKEYEYGQSCILVHNADCPEDDNDWMDDMRDFGQNIPQNKPEVDHINPAQALDKKQIDGVMKEAGLDRAKQGEFHEKVLGLKDKGERLTYPELVKLAKEFKDGIF